jgi:hypothetical protein
MSWPRRRWAERLLGWVRGERPSHHDMALQQSASSLGLGVPAARRGGLLGLCVGGSLWYAVGPSRAGWVPISSRQAEYEMRIAEPLGGEEREQRATND